MNELTLWADGLLSKWGFSDGDVLSDWAYEHWWSGDGSDDFEFDEHGALEELVVDYLLPAQKQHIDLVVMKTIHNPIRADAVDGVVIDFYNPDTNHVEWTAPFVTIPGEAVRRVIERYRTHE